MKYTAILAALLFATFAWADNWNTPDNAFDGVKESHPMGVQNPQGFVGGEDIPNAVVIPGIPYMDTGNTCGYINDYDEWCPYSGSTSPDVVYSFSPAADVDVTLDLCNSYYDTKIYVYEDSYTPGMFYACNDDACDGPNYPYPYASRIDCLPMYAGHEYFIVVDGYGGDCGDYELNMDECVPCADCPEGGYVEDEPFCEDDWEDIWNGGCNSTPNVFEDYPCGDPGVLCGTSGTYSYYGSSYRDTDWFTVTLDVATYIEVTTIAEFPLQVLWVYDLYDNGCLSYDIPYYAYGGFCEETLMAGNLAAGTWWFWVGPSVFSGVPCGAAYVSTMFGYDCDVATEETTWGSVKEMFK
jgi:hypothetical protein